MPAVSCLGIGALGEARDLAHDRVGAAQGLHRGEGSEVRRAEQYHLSDAGSAGVSECGPGHESPHAVGDECDGLARVCLESPGESASEF